MSTDVQGPPPEATEPDEEIASEVALAAPEVMANSLGEYVKIWISRVRNGESGALPVILGLVAIVIYFQARSSLSPRGRPCVGLPRSTRDNPIGVRVGDPGPEGGPQRVVVESPRMELSR